MEAFLEDLWRDRLDHPPLTGGRTPLFSTTPIEIVAMTLEGGMAPDMRTDEKIAGGPPFAFALAKQPYEHTAVDSWRNFHFTMNGLDGN